ncbi:TniB family NTP-binding protein [Rhodovulum sulfidophilum]|uniref:TniB family NTP-binding protein n=1 Tax=Rhodovulum sulfidophilum TaxID=35806 RepID=UPI001F2F7F33|nr:TniB family NTP-binding protein [Rhodovulum sulfidophilum]MCE8438990.1 TniB family NTP-binding protein [Rhodovulum sulfidophilum]MCE8467809.1 TniB family NTP-binding protein [Rhodovulum sulfidophilum]
MAHADTAKSALERVRSLHIGSARDAEAAMHTTRLLATDEQGALTPVAKRFTRTGETRGVMLIGGPGSGKSHLLERTLSKLTVLQEGEYGRPRYLGCSVPSPATFKSMTLALLAESGYPDANPRKEAWSLWQDLRHRLQLLGISVLWIDEAQDLFCADRKLILRALKSLMQGDDPVIVVLSGTEDLAKVIRTDPQVQRRFTAMVLPDLVEQVDGDSFRDIITQYCERVGLGAPIEADLIGRIFHGARYRFGRALELLLQAMEIAIGRGDDDLDIGHFAAAYAMNEACTAADNVFYAEHYWLLKPDAVDEEEQPRRKKR